MVQEAILFLIIIELFHYMDLMQFVHSHVQGHLACFLFGAVADKTAINIHV